MTRHHTRTRRRPSRPSEPAVPPALAARFAESALLMPPWMLAARLSDFSRGGTGVALGAATGTVSDRKGGRDVPLIHSEVDLRGYRVLARHICEANPFGKGFSKLLRNYHIRKGFGWQACLKGAKKTPYQTGTGTEVDPLVAKAQRILDEFRDRVQWPLKSREAFGRWCRDGEVIGRWFRGGAGRLPEFRFASPESLGNPTGNSEGDESFGICTPPGDPAGPPEAFHFWNEDGVTGEWVSADRVTFAKRNTDSDVKRGLPDFFPVANELEDCTKLVRAMLATAIRQAGTAWIEQYPNRTVTQITGGVPEYAPQTGYSGQARAPFDMGVPWWMLPQVGGGVNPWEPPGVVRKVEGDRQYTPGPTSTGVPGYVQVEQAALRGCGVIWSFPEYFSGDASNNNMASAIVAGAPFTVEVESNQFEWGAVWERPCALKVLDLAVIEGLLTADERRRLDVETTEPAVVSPDPGKDYQTLSAQLRDGVISLDTVRLKSGLDPQHEAANIAKDKAAAQPPAPAPAPFGAPSPLGESRVREERREGEVWQGDSGRWFTMKDGHTVPTSAPGSGGGAGRQQAAAAHAASRAAKWNARLRDASTTAKKVKPTYIKPVNETDPDKVQLIARRMRKFGWQGPPLVVVRDQAYVGSHRLAAAVRAGIDVPVVHVDRDDFEDACDKENIRPANVLAASEETKFAVFNRLADKRAAAILRLEALKARKTSENFTGIDANGHHWQDGKQVKAPDSGTAAAPAKPKSAAVKVASVDELHGSPGADKVAVARLIRGLTDPDAKRILADQHENMRDADADVDAIDRRRNTLNRLGAAYRAAAKSGADTAAAKQVLGVLAQFGAVPLAPAGETVPFDPTQYDSAATVFSGAPVRVVRPAVAATESDGQVYVAAKGVVEPAARRESTDQPPDAPSGA